MKRTWLLAIFLFATCAAQAGILEVTVSYTGRPLGTIEARGETVYQGLDSLLILEGVKVSWSGGETLDVKGLPVLLDRKLTRFTFRVESDSLRVYYGDDSGPPLKGKFKLDQPFRLMGPGILIKMGGGRYFMEGDKLVLFLRGSVWKRGARGFLVAAFMGLITLILMINARRTRRRLLNDRRPVKRPR